MNNLNLSFLFIASHIWMKAAFEFGKNIDKNYSKNY